MKSRCAGTVLLALAGLGAGSGGTAEAATGDGLTGEYFTNMTLTDPAAATQVDQQVDFDWAKGGPACIDPAEDNFSVRWSGYVVPAYSETYTFYTNTDDGARLWVADEQLVDQWVDQSATEYSGTIELTADSAYAIVFEYYENAGSAVAQLSWSSSSQAKEIIPQASLSSAPPVDVWIEATDGTASESGETGSFTVYRGGLDTKGFVVNVQISGSATKDIDYTLNPDITGSTITIPAGRDSASLTVTPKEDSTPEGDEDVTIDILDGDYDVGSPSQASVVIADDDRPGSFDLVTPADGTIEIDQALDSEFTWAAASDPPADTYALLVAESESLASPVVTQEGLTTASHTLTGGALEANKTYYWQVTATNVAGDTPAANGPFRFSTLDTIAPVVSRTEPADGETRVDVADDIKITFSETMKEDNMLTAFSLVDSADNPVDGTPSFSRNRLTFNPTGDLKYSEIYTAKLDPTGLCDLAGQPLDVSNDPSGGGVEYVFTFTTFETLVGVAKGEGCVPGPGASCGGAALVLASAVLLRRRAR